jgi:hypothetical protein
MESLNKEARMLLAVQASQNNSQKSVRSLAKIFTISEPTLRA